MPQGQKKENVKWVKKDGGGEWEMLVLMSVNKWVCRINVQLYIFLDHLFLFSYVNILPDF